MAARDEGSWRVGRERPSLLRLGVPAIFAALLVTACVDSPTAPDEATIVDLARPWAEASPSSRGLEPVQLASAVSDASAIPEMMSLLVVRNGALVLEEYFHGNRADSLNDVRSVTKSVVSTLTGIALQRGAFTSLDQTLGELLPDAPYQDPRQRDVTVWQLLSMSGGFDWFEHGGEGYNDWRRAEDPVAYLLGRAIVDEPGTDFTYNSASAHLLGVVVERVTGRPLPEFADEVLFGPLGITRSRWEPMPGGHHNGGAGLDLRPRDLARIGQLYLQDGLSGDRRIFSRSWAREATRPHFGWRTQFGPLSALSYGYLWWTEQRAEGDAFFAWGYGGQFIFVQRNLDLVVVATTDWRRITDPPGADATEAAVLDVIVNGVLPAVGPG